VFIGVRVMTRIGMQQFVIWVKSFYTAF